MGATNDFNRFPLPDNLTHDWLIPLAGGAAKAVGVGDLCYDAGSGVGYPADVQTTAGSLALDQQVFASKFAGVSQQQVLLAETNSVKRFTVRTMGVADFNCVSATYSVGDLLGPAAGAGPPALDPQKLTKVTNPALAIARVIPSVYAGVANQTRIRVFYNARRVNDTFDLTDVLQGISETNTNIATVGAGTLTAAALVGGVITRSGSVAAYTDTTDTAAAIVAALPGAFVGQAWEVTIKNTVPFAQTVAAGAGVTLSGQTIIPPNSVGRFLVTYSAAGAVTMRGLACVPLTTAPLLAATALTTVGAGTITAAGIAGGVTNRTGSVAAYTDTTDTAVNIIAALPNAFIGQGFMYTYYNNTLGAATITGGAGVTVTGTVVPQTCWAEYLVTYSAAGAVTMVQVAMGPNVALPAAKYTTGALQSATFAAGDITGAAFTCYDNTGVTPGNLTTRTAAQMFADIPNCQIGFEYMLAIRNSSSGANTATIVAADGTVTLTGTMTIAQNVTRLFRVKFTSATAVTIQSMGILAAGV